MIVGHAVYSGNSFFRFIFAFHIPAFFFLSGYCAEKKEETFTHYCRRKASGLLVPYLVFSLLGLLIMAVFPDEWYVNADWKTYLVQYIYIAQPYALGSVWFLVCLFFSSVACFCVMKIWSGKNAWHLLPAAIGFAAAGGGLYIISREALYGRFPMKMDSALTATAFMLFGYLFRKAFRFEKWNRWILYTGLLVLPAAVWFFGCRLNGYVNLCDCVYDHFYYYMAAALAGCVWILIVGRLLQNIRPLQWAGRNTLPMFAIHSFFLWGIESIHGTIINQHYTHLPDGVTPLILGILTYAACVPFAMLYNRIRAAGLKGIRALSRKRA